jgi:hypothetical protein
MPPRWRPILAEIEPYVVPPPLDALATELGQPILRLSANENPVGPSPLAVDAIRREAARIHLYPDGGAPTSPGPSPRMGSRRAAPLRQRRDEIIPPPLSALLDPGDGW